MMNNMMGQTVPPGMVAPAVAAAPSISAPAALTKDDTTPQVIYHHIRHFPLCRQSQFPIHNLIEFHT